MKDFNEILDCFLVEIENNPNKNIDDLIIEVSSSLKKSEANFSDKDIQEITNALGCVDELTQNINDLRNSNCSKKEWLLRKINKTVDKIPFIDEGRKTQLHKLIADRVEEVLDSQTKQLSKD